MTVTDADRQAAADAVKAYRDQRNNNWQQRIRDGLCDDGEMVQAFARHREAAEAPLRAEVERLREAIKEWRRHEVQAIGAAISTRNWHSLEGSYNQLRDKMDRFEWKPKP